MLQYSCQYVMLIQSQRDILLGYEQAVDCINPVDGVRRHRMSDISHSSLFCPMIQYEYSSP